jgi:hypothetical protein
VDVNEAGAANKILEDAATAHVRKVRGYFSDMSQKHVKQPHTSASTAEEAILRAAARGQGKSKSQEDEPSTYNQAKVEEYLQNVDPLKQNLIKSFYTLRLLKSREIKVKMIQALNYFRGVQRRLAHDVREFFSRDRALGGQKFEESLIGPQFGKDELGNLKAKKCGTSGPGNVMASRITRDLEKESNNMTENEDGEKVKDPISLKGYKFNKCFNPLLSSTNPSLPKFHTTFGRPNLYEEVSQEVERNQGNWRYQGRPIVAYKDRLLFQTGSKGFLDCDISVMDEHGIKVVYEETLNDMIQLEEEMMKIGSFYLNKAELLQHSTGDDSQQSTMLDRGEVCANLLEGELELQLVKIELVEILL